MRLMKNVFPNCKIRLSAALLFLFALLHLASAKESAVLADKIAKTHKLSPQQAALVKSVLTADGDNALTRNVGDEGADTLKGPANTLHPASRTECIKKVIDTGLVKQNPDYERVCGAPWMAPIPDANGSIAHPTACIDQFEFPNMPCEYPIVWVTISQAKAVCNGMGKRVCRSAEWEGACAGSMASDLQASHHYGYDNRNAHNDKREKIWAFNSQAKYANFKDTEKGLCARFDPNDKDISPQIPNPKTAWTERGHSRGCNPSGNSDANIIRTCSSNTWPAGMKHECRSKYDVYEMHGNLAEQTWLPHSASAVGGELRLVGGEPERKGSWFSKGMPSEDDCRIRKDRSHPTLEMRFYQEGFRCCKDAVEQ